MRQPYPNELIHYGVLGQKWGVRRYQNPDGTLTDAGKKRYYVGGNYDDGMYSLTKAGHKQEEKALKKLYNRTSANNYNKNLDQYRSRFRDSRKEEAAGSSTKDLKDAVKNLEAESDKLWEKHIETIDSGKIFTEEYFTTRENVYLNSDAIDVYKSELKRRENTVPAKDDSGIIYRKDLGDTFFDKNNDYGMDHDGNPIYNKSNKQVSEERASNKKLRNLTDGQYKRADMDLLESGGERYATQPLAVKQKLIRDYGNDRTNGSEYWSHSHGPRPTNQQALQNQYDSYLNLHPNSELTFNEFNNWFYEA